MNKNTFVLSKSFAIYLIGYVGLFLPQLDALCANLGLIDRFSLLDNPEIVLVGTVTGIVGRDGSLILYPRVPSEKQISNIRQNTITKVALSEGGRSSRLDGLTFRVKVHKVLMGDLRSDVVDVFCGSARPFVQSIDPETSFIIFLKLVRFETSAGLMMSATSQRAWTIPERYTESPLVENASPGFAGIAELLRQMVLDVDSEFSARAAMACADVGDMSAIPIIRGRFLDYSKKNDRDDQITALYLQALLYLGDYKTLVSCSDWFKEHVDTLKELELYPRPLPFKETPFEEANRQIADALGKLANADIGWLKNAAIINLKQLTPVAISRSSGAPSPGRSEEERDRRIKEQKHFENLKKIHVAKVAWAEANKSAKGNRIYEKDLVSYVKGGFPVSPQGGRYEIGEVDEFPYYVPTIEEIVKQKANKSSERSGGETSNMTTSAPALLMKTQMNDSQAKMESCVSKLRMIDSGKEQWRLQNRIKNGDPVVVSEVNLFLKNSMTPVCPEGGTYTYNAIGVNPDCSFAKTNSDGTIVRHSLSR